LLLFVTQEEKMLARLKSVCENCTIGTSAAEQFAEKGCEVLVAAVFRPPAMIAAPPMASAAADAAKNATSKPTSTAARFDEAEPAATNSKPKSNAFS
jgi:NAD(P)-dependent dehydrogenase (short-subunit alcohol dehydrogenase family)